MKQLLRITALVLMPAVVALGQVQTRPANWLDPDKSEPAGTHYPMFGVTRRNPLRHKGRIFN
jgi:hypothetical protein